MTRFGITPIKPAALIGMLEDRVQKVTALAPDAVFLSLAADNDMLSKPPADLFITIFPGHFPVMQSIVSGAGGDATGLGGVSTSFGFDAQIRTTVYSRLTPDQELRSSVSLRDSSFSTLAIAINLMARLQFWVAPVPSDDAPDLNDTYSYLRQPMRVTAGPAFRSKVWSKDIWSMAAIDWSMPFTADIG